MKEFLDNLSKSKIRNPSINIFTVYSILIAANRFQEHENHLYSVFLTGDFEMDDRGAGILEVMVGPNFICIRTIDDGTWTARRDTPFTESEILKIKTLFYSFDRKLPDSTTLANHLAIFNLYSQFE